MKRSPQPPATTTADQRGRFHALAIELLGAHERVLAKRGRRAVSSETLKDDAARLRHIGGLLALADKIPVADSAPEISEAERKEKRDKIVMAAEAHLRQMVADGYTWSKEAGRWVVASTGKLAIFADQ